MGHILHVGQLQPLQPLHVFLIHAERGGIAGTSAVVSDAVVRTLAPVKELTGGHLFAILCKDYFPLQLLANGHSRLRSLTDRACIGEHQTAGRNDRTIGRQRDVNACVIPIMLDVEIQQFASQGIDERRYVAYTQLSTKVLHAVGLVAQEIIVYIRTFAMRKHDSIGQNGIGLYARQRVSLPRLGNDRDAIELQRVDLLLRLRAHLDSLRNHQHPIVRHIVVLGVVEF